ncbi:sigma-54-dependent Fis family transcriptional regulator [Candidatus Poribacteria bacterium]|nr:sigma-54-dependent Fis family transcriptional regulator [Candidatus Poribacteria bacterium]
MNEQEKILIVDDEPDTILILQDRLEMDGYEVVTATDGSDALELIDQDLPDLVLLDIQMPRLDGIETLIHLHEKYPGILVLMLTAHGTIQRAVEATKQGAYDFLEKPFQPEHITQKVDQALEHQRTIEQSTRDELIHNYEEIVGESPVILEVLKIIEKIADTDSTVLVQGESGTGKELVARALHQNSSRREKEMVVVNCAAIPDHLLESELFGHERGAFTGATYQKIGKFERAHGSTLFLDEIADMSIELQSKLLRTIQEREIERLGGTKVIRVDVRIIAATNQDLRQAIEAGTFRQDLYYRLNMIPILLPPLRSRQEDILILAEYFLQKHSKAHNQPVRLISQKARDLFTQYDWPGNVRELEYSILRAVLFAEGDVILPKHLPEEIQSTRQHEAQNVPVGLTMKEMEKELILKTLERMEGNRTRTAEILGISLRSLQYKLKEYEAAVERDA